MTWINIRNIIAKKEGHRYGAPFCLVLRKLLCRGIEAYFLYYHHKEEHRQEAADGKEASFSVGVLGDVVCPILYVGVKDVGSVDSDFDVGVGL